MEEHTKELYNFINTMFAKMRKKCEETHKNNTYDPFEEGVTKGLEIAYLGFFQFFNEDELLQICDIEKGVS